LVLVSSVLPCICSTSNQILNPAAFSELANFRTVGWLPQLYDIFIFSKHLSSVLFWHVQVQLEYYLSVFFYLSRPKQISSKDNYKFFSDLRLGMGNFSSNKILTNCYGLLRVVTRLNAWKSVEFWWDKTHNNPQQPIETCNA